MPRYIDADALAEQMQKRYKALVKEYGDYDHYTTGYDDAIDEVEGFPSADVAPKSEVAREIFDDINAIKKEYSSGNIDGNELYVRLYCLEKKYTEGE